MMNGFPRPTELAQSWVGEVLRSGDVVVDATAGNGHDTNFLAECVGRTGVVHAFDVQQQALDEARLVCAGYENIQWHLASHALMENAVISARAVMFNLGYLPGADHSCMTCAEETIRAIDAACRILQDSGRITIVCYPGHVGGDVETTAVIQHVANFSSVWQVVKYEKIGTRRPAPILIGATKQSWSK